MSSLQKLSTILYEVQQACVQLSSVTPPQGVYDSQDETAQLMGSVANLAGIMINDARDWQQMRLPYSITGDGLRTGWDLPANFSRFIDGTGWSLGMRRPVAILNAQQWYSVTAWVSQTFYAQPGCRIYQDKLQFITAPASGEQIIFEYVDANWVIDADDNTVLKQKADKNADTPRFDWLLMVLAIKTKWLEAKGMNSLAVQSDFNDRILQLTQHEVTAPTLTLSGPVVGGFRYLDYYNMPNTNFGR